MDVMYLGFVDVGSEQQYPNMTIGTELWADHAPSKLASIWGDTTRPWIT